MNHYTIFYMNAGKECQLKRTEATDGSKVDCFIKFERFCTANKKNGIYIDDRIWISPSAIMMITYEYEAQSAPGVK